jgi:3-phenylpropionate/trans-cinnamate dioxygenase ferredoxin reductase component
MTQTQTTQTRPRDSAAATADPQALAGAAVIVGAGHAASELGTALRTEGWSGPITIVGDEAHLPYQRPPLSKAYLSGAATLDSLFLRSQQAYDEARINVLTNSPVVQIDRVARQVVLADGRMLPYDQLALTTGGRVRRLAVPDAARAEQMTNFHYLRSVADVLRLQPQFKAGMRVVIVGGGYIGLEVAAVAIKTGLQVVVLEAGPRVLARVTAPEVSSFYERVHREAGVDLRVGVELTGFEFDPSGDAVSAVRCGPDVRIPADLVIVGVGLVPNTELAAAAGLAVDNGIVVDEFARTSDPAIFSAGDCANHPSDFAGGRIRLESVPNAVEQARAAAAAMCGRPRAYQTVPWFWSDQYDLRLQMVGLSQGHDQVVVRGSTAGRSFAAFYLREGRIVAADVVSRPPEFMVAKKLVAERRIVDPALLSDERTPLKSLLQPAA